jgi:hypothetical protein
MVQLKPWQIAVIAIGLIGLVGGIAFTMFSGPRIHTPDSITMLDVQTGDRFVFDTSGRRAVIVPSKHPDTGERTLLPLYEEDGRWFVSRIEVFEDRESSELAAVRDRQTGEVVPSARSPQRVRN